MSDLTFFVYGVSKMILISFSLGLSFRKRHLLKVLKVFDVSELCDVSPPLGVSVELINLPKAPECSELCQFMWISVIER